MGVSVTIVLENCLKCNHSKGKFRRDKDDMIRGLICTHPDAPETFGTEEEPQWRNFVISTEDIPEKCPLKHGKAY